MKDHSGRPATSRLMGIIGLFLITVFITVSGISCQSQAPEPAPAVPGPGQSDEAPSDGSPLPPAEGWQADGVVDDGEYPGEATYEGFELHWANDSEFVYVAMKAPTTGWVALGIQPGSRMKDADMIFGFVSDGKVSVFDLFCTDDFGSHPPDTELGGTFDITSFGGKEADGYTTIEFKRALDTGDRYDNRLSIGGNKIIWSYGPADGLTQKHISRGYGEITITG